MRLQTRSCCLHGPRSAEGAELCHFQPFITARIDAAERLQVQIHVQGEPMVSRTAPHADADARKLSALNVNTRRTAAALREDPEFSSVVDDCPLERGYEITDAETGAAQIDERIDDELARAVVRHLPSPVDLHDGNVAGSEQMLAFG